MLILLLADGIVLFLYSMVIHTRGERFRRYLALQPVPMRNVVGALGAGFGLRYIFSILLTMLLRGSNTLQDYNAHMTELMSDNIWLVLLAVVFAAPILEEIVFRGALFRALERSFHQGIAILIPSILFALAHTDPVQMAYAFVLGLLFALVRAKSGRLFPCILMHFAFNGANFLQAELLEAQIIPPLWLVVIGTILCFFMTMHRGEKKAR